MPFLKKILATYNNIHLQSLLGNGVMAVFGVVSIGILYRALSVKEIGIYVFFMSILGLIDTLRSGFLTTAFIKFYSGAEKARANEVAGAAWCLALVLTGGSIVLNLITFLLSSYIDNEGMILVLKYFSLITLATLPSFMATLVVQGDKRFDRLLWLRLINQILFTGTVAVLAFLHKSTLTSIIITYILAFLISGLIAMMLGWTMLGSIKKVTKSSFLELFHFGKYSVGTMVSSNLFKVTDIFFINFYLGPAALAVYNLGGRLMQLIEIPLLSFVASGMPSLSGHYNRDEKGEMIYVMKKMIGMLTIFIFCIAFFSIVFAEPLIALIGGGKYVNTEAPHLFRIFMSMAILAPADRFFALTLDVIHKPKINFYKILVMLSANLLADYVGLMFFKSVYTITLANLVPVTLAIVISYPYLNKFYKFNFWNIYVVGYKETIALVKQVYRSLFSKEVI